MAVSVLTISLWSPAYPQVARRLFAASEAETGERVRAVLRAFPTAPQLLRNNKVTVASPLDARQWSKRRLLSRWVVALLAHWPAAARAAAAAA